MTGDQLRAILVGHPGDIIVGVRKQVDALSWAGIEGVNVWHDEDGLPQQVELLVDELI